MLSNELKELAVGYVLDELEPAEIVRVERLMKENPELMKEIRELQSTMGIIVSSVPKMEPPVDLLNKIMDAWVKE
jgi:anti-sigma-K factor RskA